MIRDSPGFLLNRLLVPFLNEAIELLLDGAAVEALDEAALEFGMPPGPLALFDEFGIDVALAVGRSLYRGISETHRSLGAHHPDVQVRPPRAEMRPWLLFHAMGDG